MRTKAFIKSRDERKRVEMRFAHLKVHHGFERMRLRGLSGARDEFVLAAIVQNLKTLALEPSSHRLFSSAWRRPKLVHDCLSSVRVEVAANPAATKPKAGSAQPHQNDPKAQRQPNELLFQQYRSTADTLALGWWLATQPNCL